MAVTIEIRNLHKQVICPDKSHLTILNVPSLKVEPGEQLLLTGASGSGKTTLLHALAGLITPTDGEIYYNNLQFNQLNDAQKDSWRAEHIGYIFQKLNLLTSLTVLENVMLGGFFAKQSSMVIIKQAALKLLTSVGMGKKTNLKPNCLSLGEQQRVAVVRALVKRPVIMLADEPTASLDPKNSKVILELLKQLCNEAGTTLILSTHDSRVAQKFSSCYDLQLGRRLA